MIRKLHLFMAVIATASFIISGCKKYDDEIAAIENRLDLLENKTITSIEQQIANINISISQLESVHTELDGYIKSLEKTAEDLGSQLDETNTKIATLEKEMGEKMGALELQLLNELTTLKQSIQEELTYINASIQSLKEKDTELEGMIAGLNTYVNTEIADLRNWTSVTFATLEQYDSLQQVVATIKQDITTINTSIETLEKEVIKEVTANIDAIIDDIKSELDAAYAANVETLVKEITETYNAALETAKAELKASYTQAIADAITASETSMKEWVNKTLTEGYYDIATVDAKLTSLETRMTNADAALGKQLENQRTALEQTKADITAAYQKAISDAIETNNGVISTAIAAAVQEAMEKMDIRLADITKEITALQKEIENIKNDIAGINGQIAGIKGSIADLQEVDATLQQLIDNLGTEVDNLQSQLDANASADAATKAVLEKEIADLKTLIATLQTKEAELDKKIADLQTYADEGISSTKDWASATFATLEQYMDMQTELAALKALIGNGDNEGGESDITQLTQAINDAITASEVSMKAWVNTTLAEGYYDMAAVDAKLAQLESELTSADTGLAQQLESQRAALEQAKENITKAYTQAINAAIQSNNGKITSDIANAVQAAKDELQSQIDDINTAIRNLQAQLEQLANRIQSITFIPQYSDGKVKLDYTTRTADLYFRISPAALAAKVETSMVKAFARYTADPTTRALNEEFPVSVTLATGNASTGILQVSLAEDTANPFSTAFWQGDVEAVIYIQLSDGNSDMVSLAVPLIAHSYAAGSSEIDGFGDGTENSGVVK